MSAPSTSDFLSLERWAVDPTRVALMSVDRAPLTYAGLSLHRRCTREALREAGIQPGEAVAVCLPSTAELLSTILAMAGWCASAPIDSALTEDECSHYLERLQAATLVALEGFDPPAVSAARRMGMRVLRIRPSLDSAAGIFEIVPAEAAMSMHGDAEYLPLDAVDPAIQILFEALKETVTK